MTYRLDSDIPHPYGRVVPYSSGFTYTQKLNQVGHWKHRFDAANFANTLQTR